MARWRSRLVALESRPSPIRTVIDMVMGMIMPITTYTQ